MTKNKNNEQHSGVRPAVILAIVAVIGVLIAGKILGWYGGGKSNTDVASAPVSDGQVAAGDSAARPGGTAGTTTTSASGVKPGKASLTNPAMPAANGLPPSGTPNIAGVEPGSLELPANGAMLKDGEWEQKLDDILGGNEDEKQKAEKLLQMFPHLPEDGQVEIAQHLSNLLEDDRYPALAQTFTNAATPEAVLDVLMADVLNRNNTVKLNTLLDVARTANHPKAEEAREVLEVFVDEDFGTDWAKWQAAIQNWLKENPDDEDDTGKTPPAAKDTPVAAPAAK